MIMSAGTFHWLDYVVCALSLAVGPAITAYLLATAGRQKTTGEYLLGGQRMSALAVGASLLASTLNAVYLLGSTSEVYYRSV